MSGLEGNPPSASKRKSANGTRRRRTDADKSRAGASDPLSLDAQLCFPLYVCAKGIVGKYKPILERLDLTYTQYIALLALREKKTVNVKELGEALYLDSGTLTPLLKRLEEKGLVSRKRSSEDERNLVVALTAKGEALKERARAVPAEIARCVDLPPEDSANLAAILRRLMERL